MSKIVDEASSTIGCDNEVLQPIQSTHQEMVRFESENDKGFENVVGKFRSLRKYALESLSSWFFLLLVPCPFFMVAVLNDKGVLALQTPLDHFRLNLSTFIRIVLLYLISTPKPARYSR